MGENFLIRKVRKSDFERIQEIVYNCIDFVKEKKNLKDKLREDYTLKNIEKAWRETEMFVIESKNKIAGTGRLEKTHEIRMIYICPKYQLKGFGKTMIEKLEKLAKRKKFKIVYVKALFSARNFYKKLGYNKVKDKDKSFCKMEKELE